MSQNNIILVSIDAIVASIKQLKRKSSDVDSICTFHLNTYSKELLFYL